MRAELKILTGLSVKSTTFDEENSKVVLDLSNLGGSSIFPILHVVAVGANGRRNESIIALSGRNGRASIVKPQDDFPFDSEDNYDDNEKDVE
jgi:hypothetical protein